jgi:hypothetical protein
MRMGILEGRTVRTFVPMTVEDFALTFLKMRTREGGFKYNPEGRAAFVMNCRDLVNYDSPEDVTFEESANELAYILIYSNLDLIDMATRCSVSTNVLSVLSEVIREKLMETATA